MKIKHHDSSHKVFIVAEIGNNHEGSFTLAQEMAGLAIEAGADAVKFQTIDPEKFVSPLETARIERLKKFQLSYAQFESLAKQIEKAGKIFFSTPFDLEGAEFLNTICPVFKISSGDNNFYPLIDKISSFKKPIIMSSGLATLDQMRLSTSLIRSNWEKMEHKGELAVLHCVSSYPVPDEEASLGTLLQLKELGCEIGYSDHTIGIDAAVLSVGMGARIIEKHFTINKNYSDFRDHQLSSDPLEFKLLVEKIRQAEKLIGTNFSKSIQKSEISNINAMRRSIASKRTLSAGENLKADDLMWIRPGTGYAPGEEWKVLGKKVSKTINRGEIITSENF